MDRKKIPKIKQRLIALTLALLTAFTALPSQTAYAEVNGDGNSQGTGSGIGNTVGYGSGGFARNNTGYRFYMIDNNFNRVTDVYDFVFSQPKADVFLTNSRFESMSTNTSHWHGETIASLANMAQGTQNASAITSIYPITFDDKTTKTFSVHGLDFRKWFIGNGGGSITSLGNTSRPGGSRPGGSSGSSSGNNSGGGIKDYGDTYTDFSSLPPEIKSDVIRSTLYLSSDPFRWEPSARQLNVATFQLKYGDEISKYTSKYLDNIILIKKKYNKKNAMTNDQIKRAAAMQIMREQGESDHIKFIMSMIYNKVSTASVLSHTPSDLTTVSIPLAKDSGTAQQYPAEAILARAIFAPKGFNVDIDNDGTITGMDALRYQENGKFKYYLVVEPLLSIGVTNASGGLIKRVYGSYYNVNEYWARYANNDNAVKINKTLMKSVWKQSLIVDKSYPDLSRIKPVSTYSTSLSSMTISQNKQLMDDGIGLGLHIYCGSDFDESGTHTYDSLLGTTPGPAPDPSDLPQDSPDKGGNTITIIKNYVTEVNGTEQTDGNYIRKQNPHTIEIEDEPNYKVVDWNTSTGEAPDITNGSKNPWNDLIKTSTKTQIGNASTTVELGSPEKVLYVKLKKTEGASGNPEVAGDWVLSESELTTAVSSKQATIFFA